MIKKILKSATLAILATLLITMPVLAAYYASIQVITTTTSYDMLPVILTMDNDQLATQNYITGTGLDTRVQSASVNIPHMLSDDRTLFASALASDSTANFKYITDETALSSFYILTGYGGYITTSDDADIELGTNFTVELKGYVDTGEGIGKNLVYKPEAFALYISDDTDIRAVILGASSWVDPTGFTDPDTKWQNEANAYDGNLATFTDTTAAVAISSWSSYIGITKAATNCEYFRFMANMVAGQIDKVDLDAYYNSVWHNLYEGTFLDDAAGTVWNTISVVGIADGATEIRLRFYNSDAGTPRTPQLFEVDYGEAAINATVTATGQNSGEMTVAATANQTDLKIWIDDVEEDSVALGGASVPDNANDWVVAHNNVAAYMDYVAIKKGEPQTVWISGYYNSLHSANTEYNAINGGDIWTGTEADRQQIIPVAGTLSDFRIVLEGTPSAGRSYAFNVRTNGANSGITATVANSEMSAADTTNTANVVAGDRISLQVVPTGNPISWSCWWTLKYTSGTVCNSIIIGNSTNSASGAFPTMYSRLTTTGGSFSTTQSYATKQIMPTAGTLQTLYTMVDVAPGAGETYTFALMKDGVAQSLTCQIADAATTANDTANSFAVVAGDEISFRMESTAGAGATGVHWGMVFAPDTKGESLILGGSNDNLLINNIEYNWLNNGSGVHPWDSTEAMREQLAQETTIRKLYVKLDGSPGAGNSYTFTLGVNGADTSLTVTISDLDTEATDATHEVTIADDDEITIKCEPSSSPSIRDAIWSCVGYIDPDILHLQYLPNTYIVSATLPDGTTYGNDGAITWGTNPADISYTVSGLTLTDTVIATTTGASQDVMPTGYDASLWGMAAPTNAFSDIVESMATAADIPAVVMWVSIAMFFVILTMGLLYWKFGNITIAGLVGAFLIIVFAVMGILPKWVILLGVIIIILPVLTRREA